LNPTALIDAHLPRVVVRVDVDPGLKLTSGAEIVSVIDLLPSLNEPKTEALEVLPGDRPEREVVDRRRDRRGDIRTDRGLKQLRWDGHARLLMPQPEKKLRPAPVHE
jgi:hypothetical protein